MKIFIYLKFALCFILVPFYGLADLPVELGQLKNNLSSLKIKLDILKSSLQDLGDELSYKRPVGLNKLLPEKFYGSNSQASYDEIKQRIFQKADIEGFGYKSANLMELVSLCKLVNKSLSLLSFSTTYRFSVPDFFCISSIEVQKFLKKEGLDVASSWKSIIDTYFSDKKDLHSAIESKIFPDGFLDRAQNLENDILKKFEDIASGSNQSNIINFKDLGMMYCGDFEAVVNRSDVRCMVRSSGREDTDKLANAGGNESISNIVPTHGGLMKAIGLVIASYFSQKSLMQRLWAGDTSIVNNPFTPVIVQRMIGEESGKPLPRCGVMFTEEPEGALSKRFLKKGNSFVDNKGAIVLEEEAHEKSRYRDENYKIITSGISIIQAAFGHNEGVVNSIIPVDSYMAYDCETIFPLIREKHFRIAPKTEGILQKVENESSYARKPALTGHVVRLLKIFANAIEDYYKKPMDIEFVIIKEKTGWTINIVQARPVVHNFHQPDPTYLDLNHSDIKDRLIIYGQAIGSGGGSIRYAKNSDELIITKGIGEALLTYQIHRDPYKVKAVLINEMAPSTSHEATTFRGELKPVVCFEKDFETIEQWGRQALANVILDSQQQLVLQWLDLVKAFNFDDLINKDIIKKGWINYPLPQQLSILLDYLPETFDEKRSELNQYFFKSDNISDHVRSSNLFKLPFVSNIKKLVNIIKTASENDSKDALCKIWLLVNSIPILPGYEKRVQALIGFVSVVISRLLTNLNIKQGSDEYLSKRLFLIHILETLILQRHKDETGLFCNSFVKLTHQQKEESLGARTIASKDQYAKIASMLQKYALTDDLKKKLSTFIDDFDKSGRSMKEIFEAIEKNKNAVVIKDEKIKAEFYIKLKELGDLDMLELWFNTSFANNQNVQQLVQEISQTKDFLSSLLNYKKKITSINLAGFENPATFLKNWEDFQKNILAYFVGDGQSDFAKTFLGKQANDLGRLAALGVIEQLVTQFDTAIKAVTGSTQFVVTKLPDGKTFDEVKNNQVLFKEQISSKKDKIFAFHLMLERYFELLQVWYKLSLDCKIYWLDYNKDGPSISDVVGKKIPELLENLKKETGNKVQLQSSIPAAGAAIGTGVAFGDRLAPRTLEGVFMFVHQSLLNVITNLFGKYGIKIDNLSVDLQNINNAALKIEYSGQKTSLVGVRLNGEIITLKYNLPQRLHSAIINVIFNTKTKCASLQLSMFGANHYARWERCIDLVEYNNVVRKKDSLEAKYILLSRGFEVVWPLDKNNPVGDISTNVSDLIKNLCLVSDKNGQNLYELSDNIKIKIDPFQASEMFANYIRIDNDILGQLTRDIKDEYLKTKTDNDILDFFKNLLKILKKLLDKNSDFLLESGVFIRKSQIRPADFHDQHPEAQTFYRLNKENFFDFVGQKKAYDLLNNKIKLLADCISSFIKKKPLNKKEFDDFVQEFNSLPKTIEQKDEISDKDELLSLKKFVTRIVNDETDTSVKNAIQQLQKITKFNFDEFVKIIVDADISNLNGYKIQSNSEKINKIYKEFKKSKDGTFFVGILDEIVREFCRQRIKDYFISVKKGTVILSPSVFYYAKILQTLFSDNLDLQDFVDKQLVEPFKLSNSLIKYQFLKAVIKDRIFMNCCKDIWLDSVAREINRTSDDAKNMFVQKSVFDKLGVGEKLLLAPAYIKSGIWIKDFLQVVVDLSLQEINGSKYASEEIGLARMAVRVLIKEWYNIPQENRPSITIEELKKLV